ncbi:MAG: response regulator [Chlorobi bacterium]|nr:response regulator [Chlorobiota bacterium]
MDKGLITRFCEEAIDKLEQFTQHVLALEEKREPLPFTELMRTFHNLKGSAHMLGLTQLGNAFHLTEDILSRVRSRQMDHPDLIDRLLEVGDTLEAAVAATAKSEKELELQSTIDFLTSICAVLEDASKRIFDQLAREAPDVFQVMHSKQKEDLVRFLDQYDFVQIVAVSFKRDGFTHNVEKTQNILQEQGRLLVTTGTMESPAEGFEIKFKFLLLSQKTESELLEDLEEFAAEIHTLSKRLPDKQTKRNIDSALPGDQNRQPSPNHSAGYETGKTPSDKKKLDGTAREQCRKTENAPVTVARLDEETRDCIGNSNEGDHSEEKTESVRAASPLSNDEEFRKLQQWFLEEGTENVKELMEEILALESDSSEDRLNSIFRAFHNLKGSGGSYLFPLISRVAHKLESYTASIRKRASDLTPVDIDRLLRGVDILGSVFAMCSEGKQEKLYDDRIERELTAILEKKNGQPSGNEKLVGQGSKHPSDAQDRTTILHAAPESIRVKISKLDFIAGSSVELSIAHRLEEKLVEELATVVRRTSEQYWTWQGLIHDLESKLADGVGGELRSRIQEFSKTLSMTEDTLSRILLKLDRNTSYRSSIAKELSREALNLQLYPFSVVVNTLARTLRDLARSQNKKVVLELSGTEVEMDRKIVEALKDPLVHLLRNAVDHGLEEPSERKAAGKPETGTIFISVQLRGDSFVITFQDDGRGLELEKIKETAVERGLATREEILRKTPEQIYEYIFMPGFSTRSAVTDVSGRGVGMDVVMTNIKQLGGEVYVESVLGMGTTFQLIVPTSLTLSKVMIVSVEGRKYSLPIGSIEKVVLLRDQEVTAFHEKSSLLYEDEYIPVVDVYSLLGLEKHDKTMFGLILLKGKKKLCLSVPVIDGQMEVMTKPMHPMLNAITLYSGINILPDGALALYINPLEIEPGENAVSADSATGGKNGQKQRRILVVDDSFIARELLRNILASSGYDVHTAHNGLEALNSVRNERYDVVLSDIDMPEMDGLDLIRAMKLDKSLCDVPVILISSKFEEADQKRGLEAGADAYIVKGAFNQDNLLATLDHLTGATP